MRSIKSTSVNSAGGKISLKMRLWLIIGVIILLSISVAFIGINSLNGQNDRLKHIVHVSAEKIKLGGMINQSIMAISMAEKNMLLVETDQMIKEYAGLIKTKKRELNEHRMKLSNLVDDEGKEMLNNFKTEWDAYSNVNDQVIELALNLQKGKAINLSIGNGAELHVAAASMVTAIIEKNDKDMVTDEVKSDENYSFALTILLIGLMIIIIAGGAAFIMSRNIAYIAVNESSKAASLVSNSADAIFTTDKNLVIQEINEIALKALGYSRDEVVGKMTCGDICKTPVCNTAECTIKRCMQNRGNIVATTIATSSDGTKIPVRVSCGALFDQDGNPVGGFEILSNITTVDEGFLNNMADAAFRTDKELVIQNINDAALKALGYRREEVIGKMTCAQLTNTPVCGTSDCTIKRCMETRSNIVAETVATAKDGTKIPVRAACGALFDEAGNVSGGFEVISDNSDFIKMVEVTNSIAEGDLTVNVSEKITDRDDAVGALAKALSKMVDDLSSIISNVVISAQNLAQAVEQISSGNQNLSQRTSEQASSLEEIASTIEETTATIKQNAENANEANDMSSKSSQLADDGGRLVTEAVTSINEINQSSQKIGDIISVINDISFQTNLLALNAAVEAARAGEQGRGFAVVAGEVRNLAQRSGNAAKEISVLIKDSLDKVENGTELVNKSGEALKEIIDSVKKVGKVITEIAAASQEQKQGVDQINTAVGEMDSMTQQNASLVEETASASEEMANQAQDLLGLVENFKLKEDTNRGRGSMEHSAKRQELHLKAAEGVKKDKTNRDRDEEVSLKKGQQEDITHTLSLDGFEEF
ncbi:MAG: methyl-accepting chemotaxis protein [Spirochaetota bacterium]|nr:methyl-accepting chemotaxis protein [Spirochaetota bacterium]